MKRKIFAILALCVALALLAGCVSVQRPDVDLSALSFVNIDWERSTESCIETIYFNDDGNCGYYCACGNPVNDDDLCEGYTFDPETQTIYLDFPHPTNDVITEITVISCDGETLVLDFDGEVRTFKKAVEYDPDYHEDEIEHEGKTYTYLEFTSDIFYYDLSESVDYEEDEYLPIPHKKWELLYYNGDLFVLDSQADEAIAYYADRNNYSWSVVIDDPEGELAEPIPLTVSSEDCDYIYTMETLEWETFLSFDDIELFGTLIKTSDDGIIAGSLSLAYHEDVWYWRTEVINEGVDGWPEYTVKLPDSLSDQFKTLYSE